MMEQLTFKEQAEFYRLGLISGFIDKQVVIAWADSVIESEQKPAYQLLEISMGSGLKSQELIELLQQLRCDVGACYPYRILLSRMADKLEKDLDRGYDIAQMLLELENSTEFFSMDVWEEISMIESRFSYLEDYEYESEESKADVKTGIANDLLYYLREASSRNND